MRILFVLHKPSFTRYFESMLDELGARGHRVHIAVKPVKRRETTRRRKPGPELLRRIDERSYDLIDRLCASHETITHGEAPVRADRWNALSVALRRSIDYLRYLSPAYANAPKLRARAARHTPELFVRLTGRPALRSPAAPTPRWSSARTWSTAAAIRVSATCGGSRSACRGRIRSCTTCSR